MDIKAQKLSNSKLFAKMKKTRYIIIAIVLIVAISLLSMWAINNRNNERQYNEDIAIRFDESMVASYPLLTNVSNALYIRTNMLENNAKAAQSINPYDYEETFRQLNVQFGSTENGRFMSYWLMAYRQFMVSATYGYLERGGKLRENESRAFRKLLYAYYNPEDPLEMEYDSLISECNKVKVMIAESMRDLAKYHKPETAIDAWTKIDPMKYSHMHKRYQEQKNWPFNFFNK